jgi:hypothetical protein
VIDDLARMKANGWRGLAGRPGQPIAGEIVLCTHSIFLRGEGIIAARASIQSASIRHLEHSRSLCLRRSELGRYYGGVGITRVVH